ncbi:aspartate aminotransferase family protein [Pseudemcibacter aquimaris]|uniref:aspartate aminotransferase family protein n=1 Tax=Pseudemcibacter aquimaris TaxID=2857064 RepID=UPI002011E5F9|nr:aspartate aminotransferase family protein [Pseudemcibacter aquimaris]MCC3861249.1 aspartate aminotransferase family protein [Pseudemcibacter aquimaris]WDU58023.1 aspartate aminotransferase family protein [Pseudemcibacter aquimaris]
MSKSSELYERGLKVMPGGCSRNTILRKPHPLYVDHAEGCFVTDIEGVTRIDFANNMASHIHGHSHPKIVEEVSAQLAKGTAFTLGTEAEVLYAEHLVNRSDSFEKVRFVNSGTEAVMGCLKASRAFTGRPKIAKVEGAYHGLYDYAEVSQTANPSNWGDEDRPTSVPVAHGTPQAALDDVVVIPFNDPERAIKILDEEADNIACVLLDLMPHRVGFLPAEEDFVQAIYDWTRRNEALLVCDEVITFRSNYGGAQEWYPNIKPDLTAMGKMIGGGFPVGAFAGRADVMDVMNPHADNVLFPHSGTFSANPITMTAGRVAMELFDREAVDRLNGVTEYARQSVREAIKNADVPCCVTGRGSVFRIHMKPEVPNTYRKAFVTKEESALISTLNNHLFDEGFIMVNTCSGLLSTALTNAEIDKFAEAVERSFNKMKNQF